VAALCGWEDVQEALVEAGQMLQREEVACIQREAGRLATQLAGKVAVCYALSPYGSVVSFWKIFLNETGKKIAWSGEVPEINHNEMEGYDAPPEAWAVPLNTLLRLRCFQRR
jgi:glucose/mannose-6-phosphate isomerase